MNLREELDALEQRVEDGSPTMMIRLHIQNMRRILDDAERLIKRDGTQNRLVPDPET